MFAILLVVADASVASSARADPPAAVPMATREAAPAKAREGVAVVALAGAADAAWPLAQQIYSNGSLRAEHLDEAHARVMCGEPPGPDAPADVRDLAETLAAVHGDDAPSRALLAEIARIVGVRALVVVRVEGDQPVAHVFLADAGSFDAAIYRPDAGPGVAWTGAVRSLARTLGASPAPAPALATHPVPRADTHTGARPFYLSPWFWGALGVAAAAGGAAYLVSRDGGSPTIHLEVEVPHQ
ncbi:MAG TPA: hypothetical protein VEK07_20625 [Polyangiaceae bacterium]|nr:hypothetical protein [Polyangiaceae bacterium]